MVSNRTETQAPAEAAAPVKREKRGPDEPGPLGEQSRHIVHYIHSFVKANKIIKVLSERGPSHLGHLSFYAFLREYKKKGFFFLLFSLI